LLFTRIADRPEDDDKPRRSDTSDFYVATDFRRTAVLTGTGTVIKAIHSRPVTIVGAINGSGNGAGNSLDRYPLGYLIETGIGQTAEEDLPGLRYLGRTSLRAVLS
jgi:hypothetical protein